MFLKHFHRFGKVGELRELGSVKTRTHGTTFLITLRETVAEVESSSSFAKLRAKKTALCDTVKKCYCAHRCKKYCTCVRASNEHPKETNGNHFFKVSRGQF